MNPDGFFFCKLVKIHTKIIKILHSIFIYNFTQLKKTIDYGKLLVFSGVQFKFINKGFSIPIIIISNTFIDYFQNRNISTFEIIDDLV